MAAEYEVNIKINTQQIERELKKVDKAVNNIGKGKKGGRASGLGLMPGDELKRLQQSRIYLGQAVQGIDRLAKIQDRRARSLNKINELEAKGLSVGRLRRQLVKATTEQSRRRLGSAEKEFRVLEKSIRLEQSKLRILKEQRKGFASSPVRGTRTMMGSPAQIAAAARAGGATSPIRGGLGFPGSPAFLAGARASRTPFGPSFPTGGAFSPVRGGFNFPGSPIALAGSTVSRTPFGPSFPTGGAALPIGGSTAIPGSPKAIQAAKATELRATQVQGSWNKALGQLQETAKIFESRNAQVRQSWTTALGQLSETAKNISTNRTARVKQSWTTALGQLEETAKDISRSNVAQRGKRRRQRLEQVGLGAGFPLLFGGGPGSVIGGGLGGLTGSFGAQIALSAAGQQIDQLIERTVASAESLGSVGTALDFLRERSLFSSKESEQLARKLENQGDLTGIAALVTEELNEALGPGGIQKMQDLAEQTRLAKEQWGQLTTNLELLIAGPLAEFLKIVNATLGIKVAQSQFARALTTLQEKDPQRLRGMLPSFEGAKDPTKAIASNLAFGPNMAGGIFNMQGLSEGALTSFTEQMNSIIRGMGTPDGVIPITEEDRKRFKPKKDSGVKEEERLQKRLGKLEEERKKVLEISRFRDKIAAAEAVEDDELVIRLQGEQQIAEIEASRLKALVGVADQRERDAINIGKATEKLAAHRNTERELEELQRQRQEKFEDTIENLEHQLALATATSEAERERLRIEKELQELRKGGMSESQLGQVGDLMRQISAENSPLNQFIKQSVESLNDLEQHAVQVSQGIGNAIGNSLVNGLQNLVTGAQSVKEVFANMLKAVADVLAQQAAQMIATYISIGVARIFAGFAAASSTTPPTTMPGASVQTGGGLNINGVDQFIAPPTLASSGGYFGGPTNAVIGEGGEPEYVIPESKMRESMARYSRGARGSSVIPDSGVSGTSGEGGGVAVAAPIDVRYTVERINSVDYVTADQFQRGLQQAAAQGATQGEQRALTTLRQNTSQRRRIGL